MTNRYYELVFKAMPRNYVLFDIDEPTWTILDMSDSFLSTLGMTRKQVKDNPLFVVFPANKLEADTTIALKKSLYEVLKSHECNRMPVVRYDIPIVGTDLFTERYWRPENYPVIENGKLIMIIHTAIDLTAVKQQVNFNI